MFSQFTRRVFLRGAEAVAVAAALNRAFPDASAESLADGKHFERKFAVYTSAIRSI